jgi:putative DNA primase/helicase
MSSLPTGKFSEMTKDESIASCAKTRHELRKEKKEPTAILKTFSQIIEKAVEWLWPDHIPISMFTIFAGEAGLGKTTLSLFISARLSRGLPFPDNSISMLGDTLILAGEDDPAYTIKPRLQALGADMDRIHILMGKRVDHGDSDFILTDTNIIRDAIDQIRAQGGNLKLVIIDPLESFLGSSCDIFRNNEVRAALRGIISLAQKEQFSIIAIQHLTKKLGISANNRISGSVAFVAAARCVWMVAKDPDSPGNCLFLNSKMNIAPKIDGYRFSIVSQDGIGVPAFGERINLDADDILNAEQKPKQKIAPDQEAVLEYLQNSGPGNKTLGEIAEALGKSKTATSNILSKLKEKGSVHSPYYGQWAMKQVSLSPSFPIGEVNESESIDDIHSQFHLVKVDNETE